MRQVSKKNAPVRVYVSGPISGRHFARAYQDFARAEQMLKDRGFDVVNPMNNGLNFRASHAEHMRVDLRNQCSCDGIFYIRHWRRWWSRGVWTERIVAWATGMITVKIES